MVCKYWKCEMRKTRAHRSVDCPPYRANLLKCQDGRECVQTLRQFPRFSIYNRNQLPVVVGCQLARLLPRSNARQSSHVSCLPWNMLTRLHASPGIIKIRNHEEMALRAAAANVDLFVPFFFFFFNLDLARVEKFIRLKTKFFSHSFILKLITRSFLVNFLEERNGFSNMTFNNTGSNLFFNNISPAMGKI